MVLKESVKSREEVEKLKELCEISKGSLKKEIEKQIYIIEKGIKGEDEVMFQLKYSGMDMFILRDLFVKSGDLSAQIDFFIVTPKLNFIIECKNLFGNITINNRGDFIRSYNHGSKSLKEGIESPITQNERHLQVFKDIRVHYCPTIAKNIVDKHFYDFNKSLVVLANSKTILNDRFAPKEIKEQVIRADQLVPTIKRICDSSKEIPGSIKEMRKFAEWMLSLCTENDYSYVERYQEKLKKYNDALNDKAEENVCELCPRCGSKLVLRKGKRGAFIGCSSFPKCRYTKAVSDKQV